MGADDADLMRMRKIMGHQLLNIASGIQAAGGYLAGQLQDRMTSREKEYFPLIRQECDKISFMVSRMNLLFGEIQTGNPEPVRRTVDLALETIRADLPIIECASDFSGDDSRKMCSISVKICLTELIKNAWEASARPVVVSVCEAGDEYLFRVIDQGDGFSDEAQEMAFKMFYTTRVRALGLGLSIARRYLDMQGGRISMGRESRGNFVEFTLPVCVDMQLEN